MTPTGRLAIGWIFHQHAAIFASAFASSAPASVDRIRPSIGLRLHAQLVGIPLSVSRRFAQPRQPTTSLTAIFAARGGASSPFNGNNVPTVLVTGGTGYTRSHTCLEVLRTGRYRVGVMDNLKNSSEESLDRVRELLRSEEEDSDKTETELSDAAAGGGLHFRNCDVHHGLGEEFPSVSGCVHSAGLNAMGELVTEPLDYYGVNASGTACLLKELESAGVPRFVLSSSTTMYGTPEGLPLQEDARLTATNS